MNSRQWLIIVGLSLFSFLIFIGCSSSDDPITSIEDCSLSLTAPVPGSSLWHTGDSFIIRWDKTGVADSVRIDLKKDDIQVGTINAGTVNDRYFRWYVSTFDLSSGNDYTIVITALGEESCSAEAGPYDFRNTAGCNFALTGILGNLLDRTFTDESVMDITWESSNTSGDVKIELIDPIGFIGIISDNTPDNGHYPWSVTSFHNDSYRYFSIRVSDLLVDGCSVESDTFRVDDGNICSLSVVMPSLNQVLTLGASFDIMFSLDDMGGNVDIWLYTGMESVGSIATNVDPASGSFTWIVDDFGHLGSNQLYGVRVAASDDHYCWGQSDRFTISP